MTAPLLAFDALHYRYPGADTPALCGASLEVRAGEKIALMGRNGSGKSTLLLHGNGLLRPQQGVVRWRGAAIGYHREALRTLRSQVGLIFQNPDEQLFAATVLQDLAFGPLNSGASEQEARKRAEWAAARCQIEHLLSQPPHALSGGQKLCAALAGVLAMRPLVLLADEVTSGLDPWMRRNVLSILDDHAAEGGSVVLSTHELDVARCWASKIALMEEGRVVHVAPPQEFFTSSTWRARIGADLWELSDATPTQTASSKT
ncbi:MAG: energy-coupling factor ABC transporter ATP-binding protein [Caldilinea sp.]|nr:energy-coupling factor ABC transporter ATP-binding protein [Caldilinea sp.]MDW8441568.1 energy-coupling factor ABC transporter ATP-binding protein [Caldilineaceae bacterium]